MFVTREEDDRIRIKASAKINLFLEVLNKRPDGYHNINSLFQAISLFDELEFVTGQNENITLEIVGDKSLAGDETNLVCRAFRMMQQEFGLQSAPIVRLNKQIPVAAGLGGGSSDAAATILACNLLYSLNLSYPEMSTLGARIGSDVPFFFCRGQASVSGRGEIVNESDFPIEYELLLVTPNRSVSTAEAYAALERGLTNSRSRTIFRCCETVDDYLGSLLVSGNDFENMNCDKFPEFDDIKRMLLEMGARLVRLSGSGPTIFGIFDEIPGGDEHIATDWGDWRTFGVRPITLPAG